MLTSYFRNRANTRPEDIVIDVIETLSAVRTADTVDIVEQRGGCAIILNIAVAKFQVSLTKERTLPVPRHRQCAVDPEIRGIILNLAELHTVRSRAGREDRHAGIIDVVDVRQLVWGIPKRFGI